MSQNIIDVSWDLAKFDTQTQAVLANMTKVYELAGASGSSGIKPGSNGGYTELIKSATEFNKVQENTLKLTGLQEKAEQERLKTQKLRAQADAEQLKLAKAQVAADNEVIKQIALEDAAEQKLLKVKEQKRKEAEKLANTSKPFDPNSVPFTINTGGNEELKKTGDLLSEVERKEAAAAVAAAEFGNSVNQSTSAIREQGVVSKKTSSEIQREAEIKKQLGRLDAQSLKNSVREQLAEKGSLEQRRAALIRLTSAYDNLSQLERSSPFGIRLKSTVDGLTTQIKTLEAETGRAQRNVGNYGSAFTNAAKGANVLFGALRKIAYIIPGLGLAGLIGLIIDPLIEGTKALLGFGEVSEKVKKQQEEIASAYRSAAEGVGEEISKVTVLKTVLESENATRQQKITALKDLKSINYDYFGQLDLENDKVSGLGLAYDGYVQKLIRSINAKANIEQLTQALKAQNAIIGDINKSGDYAEKHTINNLTEYERVSAIAEFNLDFGNKDKKSSTVIDGKRDQLIVDLLNARDRVKNVTDLIKGDVQDAFDPKKPPKEKKSAVTKESTKAALDLEFELYKISQQRKLKILDEEASDTKRSFGDRMIFAEDYMKASIELAERTTQHEIAIEQEKLKALESNLKTAKGTEKNNLLIEIENEKKLIKIATAKKNDELINIEAAYQKMTTKIAKDETDAQLKILEEAEKSVKNVKSNEQAAIEASYARTLASLDKLLKDGKIKQEFYDKEKAKSVKNMEVLQLESQLREMEGLRSIMVLKHEDIKLIDKQIDKQRSLIISAKNATVKPLKGDLSELDKRREIVKDVQMAEQLTQGLVDIKYQKEIEAIQKIIDLNNLRKEQEIKNIEQSTLSTQEKAAQMIILDNSVAANNRKHEREKAAIAIKQAKFDRDMAVLNILSNVAAANFKLIAQGGFAGIAAGIAVGLEAMSAIAMLLAKPLPTMPAYAEGTDNHPGGPAIVGEGKYKELVSSPDGKSFIADRPMLLNNLPKGSKVKPLTSDIINEAMYSAMVIGTAQRLQTGERIANHKDGGLTEIRDAVYETGRMTAQALRKQRGAKVVVYVNGSWNDYITESVKE